MKYSVRLVGLTQPTIEVGASGPEDLVSYCARVSNPSNQTNFDTSEKLLRYCIKNHHWSVFDMVDAIVEVKAPRDITRQILRHSSFKFQEFSQRYSDEIEFTYRSPRSQDVTNRQNSVDDLKDSAKEKYFHYSVDKVLSLVEESYKTLIKMGVAKECARVILPEGLTMSTLYMKGSLRSWIHYLEVRTGNGTQKEHQDIAKAILEVLKVPFPITMSLLEVNP